MIKRDRLFSTLAIIGLTIPLVGLVAAILEYHFPKSETFAILADVFCHNLSFFMFYSVVAAMILFGRDLKNLREQ